ncbi:cytidylate kinase [Paenibacillus baekrokdamisoli]|uniref:Cytidylate kinase n=1 Tax=Paenibacillus baekrokdamisoli TaxID=1712516 RepID=A0A3G9JDF2_9BACL|nr:(d)CMP kinase [Paenibacillus baekrokdamisoli]MBB3069627.1 cytidylate kinase [Paenibacillus baekrokdamisoli]BBH21019.1 cytidylate kinase [Paenibacillus baekrokdamisoli]
MSRSGESDSDRINVAIDGPAGAGKSTVARKVAEKLGYIYVDTGAMYRAVTLAANRLGIEPHESDRLKKLVESIHIRLKPVVDGQIVLLNEEDVTNAIRTREVTLRVSQVASHEAVRMKLVDMQRELASLKGIVMDGRDIGTQVLPQAELKIFLIASVQIRALRRYQELKENERIPLQQLEQEIADRDRSDEQREISPLSCAKDAIVLDSSELTIDQVVALILDLSRTKMAEAK